MVLVAEPCHEQVTRRSMKSARIARLLAPPPDAKRPSRVRPCQRSVLRCLAPKLVSCLENGAMSKSLAELAREVARVQGQPAGKRGGRRDQRRKPANAGAEVRMGDVWTTTPPLAHGGRSFDVSRWKVGRIALGAKSCEGTRSATDHQTLLEDSSKFGKERGPSGRRRRSRRCHSCVLGRLLCPRSSPSPWFTACCCSDGSLAVMQPLWVQQTAEESFSRGSVQPHFAGDVHASVRASDMEEKGSSSTACATSPILVGRDRRFRNWGIYRSPRWICFNGSTSACPG